METDPTQPQVETPRAARLEIAHVLFTDVVGYSRLPMEGQTESLRRLQEVVRGTEEFREAQARGRLISLPTGDGMALVFFGSPEDPARCAMSISRALRGDAGLGLRMGVHSGPVYRVADINAQMNVSGGGINVAQRVMDCGDAGHILVSNAAAEVLAQLSGWEDKLHDLGEAGVKHGARVHLFNLYTDEFGNPETPRKVRAEQAAGEAAGGTAVAAGAAETRPTAGGLARRKLVALAALSVLAVAAFTSYYFFSGKRARVITSVAVLPFTNTGGDQNMEYLSDGISESLINSLSQLPGMKVIARSSSFKYKGKEVDPQEVAKALGVQAVVSGRVGHLGDQLLVSVDVVDAGNNSQLWGAQYNRRAEDLLAVQSEISGEIAEKLRVRLSAGEQQQLARRETVNPQAYERLLRGRFYSHMGAANQKRAVEYLQQAITIDPAYALAHAELSLNYSNLVLNSLLDPKEGVPKAEDAANTALKLDDNLADAHLALANLKSNAWKWADAEREYKRAVDLNPNHVDAHRWYANYLTVMGRSDQAIAEVRRARELDPLSIPANADVGFHLIFARRYDEAIESLKKTMELDRTYPTTYTYLAYAYAAKGLYAEAVAAQNEVIKRGADGSSTQIYMGAAYALAGEREKARAILKQQQTSADYVSPAELATLYVALGEREQAFASLERAYAAHDLQLQYLGGDPTLESLRPDPHYRELMQRVGLPVR